MLTPIVALSGAVVMTAAARPVFFAFDRRVARRRLRTPARAPIWAPAEIDTAEGIEERCASFLDDVVRGLRNNEAVFDCVSLAVHRHPELSRWLSPVVVAANDSGSFDTAPRGEDPPAVAVATRRLVLATRPGVTSIAVLESGSRDLRARAQLRARARASAAGVRSSVAFLSWLPLVLIAVTVLVSPGVLGDVARHPQTACAAVAGLALNHAGRIWMRRIVAAVLA